MSRPHIAYVLTRFPKLSETFVVDEILALERRGFPVEVCALRPGAADAAPAGAEHLVRRRVCLPALGGEVLAGQLRWLLRAPLRLLGLWALALLRHLGSPRALPGALLACAHAPALALRLERAGVDHLHAHWATHSALAVWAIHRLAGLPYSFTTHADDLYVRRPMLEEKAAAAHFVVTISDFGRRYLLGELQRPEAVRARVVHCGVATASFRPLPPPPAEAPFTIASIGRLEPKKGHRVLLEACRLLAERGVDFRCRLVGEGRERPALERACRDPLLRGRVELLGARSRAEVLAVLAGAHAAALPCQVAPNGRADGIPVALMEAMALGRPVVSTAVSGIPELIEDGASGLLVEAGDASALADALERLQRDPALAARLAAAGRARVEADFDLDANVGRLAALFEAGTAGLAASADAVGVAAALEAR